MMLNVFKSQQIEFSGITAVECQAMVIGANSMATGIPSLGCGEEGNCIQCK